ncbi:hypothetical protein INT45_000938 [Circinella minor]|uniref:Uncharacterized protein n=1 Tax=Circinella minor TaxID=1195481 RepID=A0A8H7S2F8_9FUNG|nr:hypothetical protein INT45_000938 [Circinella minor]
MAKRERRRLLHWQLDWLPGLPITCRCTVAFDISPNPINYLLNKLPRRLPYSPRIINFWNRHWTRLMVVMADIDQVCHLDEEKPKSKDSNS